MTQTNETSLGDSNYGPTRSERLRFDLRLDKSQVDANQDDVCAVLGTSLDYPLDRITEGDTLRLGYEVGLHYFGDVEKRLAAMNRILTTPDLVKQVSLEELTTASHSSAASFNRSKP